MGELPIGVAKHEYRSINKSKEGGSLGFAYSKDGWLANTVGHVLAVPIIHLPLLTLKDAFHNPPEELVKTLSDRWKDVPFKGDVLVRVGHASVIGDIKRLLATDEQIKGRVKFSTTAKWIDRAARYPYIPLQVMKTLLVKMMRLDNYDPITNTISVFHPNKAIGMHEIGHGKFFSSKENPTNWYMAANLVPLARTYTEYKATEGAMKQFSNDAERKQALTLLEPAFATYLVPSVLGIAAPKLLNAYAGIGSLAAGHIMARLPNFRFSKQYERFGYVFEGKEPKKEKKFFHGPSVEAIAKELVHKPVASSHEKKGLGDHQVYESTARAIRPIHGSSARNLF